MNNKKFEQIRKIQTEKACTDFNFTTILQETVGAQKWKEKDGLWALLSCSMNQFSSEVFEKINNYTKNMIDVETCEPHMLKSIAESVNLSQLTDFIKDVYPEFINKLVNTFSINYRLLLNPVKVQIKNNTNNTSISNLEFLNSSKFLSKTAITQYFGAIDQRNKGVYPFETGYSSLFFLQILNNLDKLEHLLKVTNELDFNTPVWSYIREEQQLEINSLDTTYLFLKDYQTYEAPTLQMIFDELYYYKSLAFSDSIPNKNGSVQKLVNTNEIIAVHNYYGKVIGETTTNIFNKAFILNKCTELFHAKDFKEYQYYYAQFGQSKLSHLESLLFYWRPYEKDIINNNEEYQLINNYEFTANTKIINPFLTLIAVIKNIAYNSEKMELMKVSYIEDVTNNLIDLSKIILQCLETLQNNELSYYYNLIVFHFYGVLYDNIFNEYLKKEWKITQTDIQTNAIFIGTYSEYTKEEFIERISPYMSNEEVDEFIKNGPILYNQYQVNFIQSINILNNIISYGVLNQNLQNNSITKLSYYIPYYNNDIDILQETSYLYDNNFYKYKQVLNGIFYEFCECSLPNPLEKYPHICKTCEKIIKSEETKHIYNINLQESYLYKAALLFADYCIKIKNTRESIKNSIQQYTRIGTAKLLNDIIADYFYKQFSKRSDWLLHDNASQTFDSLEIFNLFKSLSDLNAENEMFNINIVEYYDKTNYLNIESDKIVNLSTYTQQDLSAVLSTVWTYKNPDDISAVINNNLYNPFIKLDNSNYIQSAYTPQNTDIVISAAKYISLVSGFGGQGYLTKYITNINNYGNNITFDHNSSGTFNFNVFKGPVYEYKNTLDTSSVITSVIITGNYSKLSGVETYIADIATEQIITTYNNVQTSSIIINLDNEGTMNFTNFINNYEINNNYIIKNFISSDINYQSYLSTVIIPTSLVSSVITSQILETETITGYVLSTIASGNVSATYTYYDTTTINSAIFLYGVNNYQIYNYPIVLEQVIFPASSIEQYNENTEENYLTYNNKFWDTSSGYTGLNMLTDEEILNQCKFYEQYFSELKNAVTDSNKIETFKTIIYPFLISIWDVHANKLFVNDLSDFNNYYSGVSGKYKIENLANNTFPTIAPIENIQTLFTKNELSNYESLYIVKNYYKNINGYISGAINDITENIEFLNSIVDYGNNLYLSSYIGYTKNGLLPENTNFHGYASNAEKTYKTSNNLIKNDVDGAWKYSSLQAFIKLYAEVISAYVHNNYNFIVNDSIYTEFKESNDTQFLNINNLLSSTTLIENLNNISFNTYNILSDYINAYIEDNYDSLNLLNGIDIETEISKLIIYSPLIYRMKNFKIADYKKDFYNNHYILFKHYKYDKYEDIGEIWFRYKNNPLAMPFMKSIKFISENNSYSNIKTSEINADKFLSLYDQVICEHKTYTKIIKQMANNAIYFDVFDDVILIVGYTNFVKYNNTFVKNNDYKYLKIVLFKIYENQQQIYIDNTSIKFISTHTENDYLININEFIGAYVNENNINVCLYNINDNITNIQSFKYQNSFTSNDVTTYIKKLPLTFSFINYNKNNYMLDFTYKTYNNLKYPIIGFYTDNIALDTYNTQFEFQQIMKEPLNKQLTQSVWKATIIDNKFSIGYESISDDILNANDFDNVSLEKMIFNSSQLSIPGFKVEYELLYRENNNIFYPILNKLNIISSMIYLHDTINTIVDSTGAVSSVLENNVELNGIHQSFPKCNIGTKKHIMYTIPTKLGGIKNYKNDITYDQTGLNDLSELITSGNLEKYLTFNNPNLNMPALANGLEELAYDINTYHLQRYINNNLNDITYNYTKELLLSSICSNDGLTIDLDLLNNYKNEELYKLQADSIRFLPAITDCLIDDMKIFINFGQLDEEIKNFITGTESFDLDISVFIDDRNIEGSEYQKKVGWHCGYINTDFIEWESGDNRHGGPETIIVHLKKYYNYLYNKFRNANNDDSAIYLQSNFIKAAKSCKISINVCWYAETILRAINPNIEVFWNGIYYRKVVKREEMTVNTGCCDKSYQDIINIDLINHTFAFTQKKYYQISTIYNRITKDLNIKYNIVYTVPVGNIYDGDLYKESYNVQNNIITRTWTIIDIDTIINGKNNGIATENEIVKYLYDCMTLYDPREQSAGFINIFNLKTIDRSFEKLITGKEITTYVNTQHNILNIFGYYFANDIKNTMKYAYGNILANQPIQYGTIPEEISNDVFCNTKDNSILFDIDIMSACNFNYHSKYYNLSGCAHDAYEQNLSSTFRFYTDDNHLIISQNPYDVSSIISCYVKNAKYQYKNYNCSIIPSFSGNFVNKTNIAYEFYNQKRDFIYHYYPTLIYYYDQFNTRFIGNNIEIYQTYFIGDKLESFYDLSANNKLHFNKNIQYTENKIDVLNTIETNSYINISSHCINQNIDTQLKLQADIFDEHNDKLIGRITKYNTYKAINVKLINSKQNVFDIQNLQNIYNYPISGSIFINANPINKYNYELITSSDFNFSNYKSFDDLVNNLILKKRKDI